MSNLPEYVKLANELEIPSKYIIKNLSDFKPLLEKIKNAKISMPPLNFTKIRKKILEIYSKEKIATELSLKIKEKYKLFKTTNKKDKTTKLRFLLYKQKFNRFFLTRLVKKLIKLLHLNKW